MIITKHHVYEYIEPNGSNPFRKWLDSLPIAVSARIQARVFRLERGNLGDSRAVGHGVYEIRCHFGPGFRIYFAPEGKDILVLLAGGDKHSQKRDIIRARQYWLEFRTRR